MTVRFFRGLLLADMGFLVVWTLFGFFGDPFLPEELRPFEEGAGTPTEPMLKRLVEWLSIPDMILYLLALGFLWRVQPLGRVLYVASFVLGVLLVAPSAYVISSGPLFSLEAFSSILSVAILLSPFLPPLSSHFEHHPNA